MKSSEDVLLCVAIILAAMAAAGLLTTSLMESSMEAKAVENNCARYHPKTGNFEWISHDQGEAQ